MSILSHRRHHARTLSFVGSLGAQDSKDELIIMGERHFQIQARHLRHIDPEKGYDPAKDDEE
jgi:hypothetical protein